MKNKGSINAFIKGRNRSPFDLYRIPTKISRLIINPRLLELIAERRRKKNAQTKND